MIWRVFFLETQATIAVVALLGESVSNPFFTRRSPSAIATQEPRTVIPVESHSVFFTVLP